MHYLRKIVFCFNTGKALISYWRLHKLSPTTFKFTFTSDDDNKVCNDCIFDFGIGSVVSTTASYNVSLLYS